MCKMCDAAKTDEIAFEQVKLTTQQFVLDVSSNNMKKAEKTREILHAEMDIYLDAVTYSSDIMREVEGKMR